LAAFVELDQSLQLFMIIFVVEIAASVGACFSFDNHQFFGVVIQILNSLVKCLDVLVVELESVFCPYALWIDVRKYPMFFLKWQSSSIFSPHVYLTFLESFHA